MCIQSWTVSLMYKVHCLVNFFRNNKSMVFSKTWRGGDQFFPKPWNSAKQVQLQEYASDKATDQWLSYPGMHHKACKIKVNCMSPFGVLLGWIYVAQFNSTTRILLMLFWKWSSNTSCKNPKYNFVWPYFHSWIIFVNKRSQSVCQILWITW
jgi:hypothetical protein